MFVTRNLTVETEVFDVNESNYRDELNKALKERFKGRERIASKRKTIYPYSVEREYQRDVKRFLVLYKNELKECLPEIIEEYKKAIENPRYDAFNVDGLNILESKINAIVAKIKKRVVGEKETQELKKLVSKYGNRANDALVKEWSKTVKDALGVDIFKDYYKGGSYKSYIEGWVDENVDQIVTIPKENLEELKEIIYEGYTNGKGIGYVKEKIQERYNVSKRKAVLVARDQMGTLTAQITKKQQEDAGCESYVWSTSRDSRVRECHKELDGKRIRWDDPPEMWYRLKSGKKVFTGRKCHPGEDYCCRCVALAEFVFEALDLPIDPMQKRDE